MKTKNLIVLFLTVALQLTTGHLIAQNKVKAEDPAKTKDTIVNYAEFQIASLDDFYKKCVTAMHLADMDIDPVKSNYGKANGLIETNIITFKWADMVATYTINLHVFAIDESRKALHIIFNDIKMTAGTPIGPRAINLFNNSIGDSVNNLISELEKLAGKNVLTKTISLYIQ
jgi:hypothetical protein